ncbi:glutathione transferase GstA [Thiomonas sp. FB-6]|uniref:glutathione transferase GstA n=1 Tax=Thiomonas sp. FB-6 TaxID=1158291 RepID=UPI000371EF8C|nr:glutathione transferase GstA [Thiomonas sp. FB-6]
MKLYFSPGACSLSPHIVLRELGLPAELVKVDLGAKTYDGGQDFRAVNPKGYVPVLQLDDGSVLTEGPAIVQYLADQKPASGLAPANGSLERYRLQEWLNFISTELHKQYSPLFNPQFSEEVKELQRQRLYGRFDYLAQVLGAQDFLMGTQFTVADAYLFTVLGWSDHVKLDLSRWPALQAYLERVAQRPAVAATLAAEREARKS